MKITQSEIFRTSYVSFYAILLFLLCGLPFQDDFRLDISDIELEEPSKYDEIVNEVSKWEEFQCLSSIHQNMALKKIEQLVSGEVGPEACWAPNEDSENLLQFNIKLSTNFGPQLSVNRYFGKHRFGTRWSWTSSNGGGLSQGDPTTITWSIIPDGISIAGYIGEAASSSNLVAFLDGIYGNGGTNVISQKPWFTYFEQIFESWANLTGNTYVYAGGDDGASFVGSSGSLGVRGDVRIGGHYIDGNSGVLAYNFFPNTGDMVIDTGDNFYSNTGSNSLRLRNVLAHEHGHRTRNTSYLILILALPFPPTE